MKSSQRSLSDPRAWLLEPKREADAGTVIGTIVGVIVRTVVRPVIGIRCVVRTIVTTVAAIMPTAFCRGVKFSGLALAEMLDEQCLTPR
jgi:hypothetical protein